MVKMGLEIESNEQVHQALWTETGGSIQGTDPEQDNFINSNMLVDQALA